MFSFHLLPQGLRLVTGYDVLYDSISREFFVGDIKCSNQIQLTSGFMEYSDVIMYKGISVICQ